MMGRGALILVIGFGVVFSIVGLRLNSLENRAIENMTYYHDVTTAHNIATAGANTAMAIFYQNQALRGSVTSQTFTTGNYATGSFSSSIDSLPNKLRLRSLSNFKGFNDTVEVYFYTNVNNSFSLFSWLTNNENGVYWITGDTVWGRVHSNGTINVSGRPVYMEKVTTSKAFNPKPGTNPNNAIFKKGYETGVANIPFPTDLSALVSAASSGGRYYTGNVFLTLSGGSAANGDGKVYVRSSAVGPIIDSVSLADPSFNGVMYATGTTTAKGTLDGRLTIASGTDIVISDDLLYEQNPLLGASDDLLGIVANNNVMIADNVANRTNCEIDGTIFCRSGSFLAENYSSRPVSGTLKIIGGVIQNNRGAVGTFSGSSLVSGFSKRYYYDKRLADNNYRPPFFPGYLRSTYAIANWWENVRVPSF